MKRLIHISKLRPGMVLADNVNVNNVLLLAGGSVIKPSYIERFRECGITKVAIYDKEMADQEIILNPVESFYKDTYQTIEEIFSGLNKKTTLDIEPIFPVLETILETVFSNQNNLLLLTGYQKQFDSYYFAHSLDVCIYSLITAKAMELSPEENIILGTGALLHDIGKSKVPASILSKKGSLTADEFQKVKKHSAYGYYLLKQNPQIHPDVLRIVLEHHERCDGSGYPYRLQAREIYKLSKIVAVADIYDALTSDRVFRKKILPHEAAELLLSISNSQLDPEITKIFMENIAIYPKGCQVLLNTNEIAVVIDSNRKMPLRPRLKILTTREREPLQEPFELDLRSDLRVFITHIFS